MAITRNCNDMDYDFENNDSYVPTEETVDEDEQDGMSLSHPSLL